MWMLAQRLVAVQCRTVETARPLVCLPTLTILNIHSVDGTSMTGCRLMPMLCSRLLRLQKEGAGSQREETLPQGSLFWWRLLPAY